jgi:hypothetical protein
MATLLKVEKNETIVTLQITEMELDLICRGLASINTFSAVADLYRKMSDIRSEIDEY